VQSSVDSYLYLLSNGHLILSDDDSGGVFDANIVLEPSNIKFAAYAEACYQAVDPNNERSTFADWKSLNFFDQNVDFNATFRNV
jgi:hypothetical protein